MTNRAQIDRRISEVEAQLAAARSPRAVVAWAAARWGVTQRQGRTYVERVRERWASDGTAADRTTRRDHMRASLDAIVAMATMRTEVVRDGSGRPLIDATTGLPLRHHAPDLRAALRALDALARLDGLNAPAVRSGVPETRPSANTCPTCGFFDGWTTDELTRYATTGELPAYDGRTA